MNQNLINHVAFVVDRSTSIRDYRLVDTIISVFDNQIKWLAKRSEEVSQETRVSVFLFGSEIECVIYDMDVLRLPSLKELYKVEGATRLIDATIQTIDDLKETPEKYGDHAFLVYVLTDGEENSSNNRSYALKREIDNLPDNWTLAAYVPNQRALNEAISHGFAKDNIAVWSVGTSGLEAVGNNISKTTDAYFTARAKGIRGSKSLFKLDLSSLTPRKVASKLTPLMPYDYQIFYVGQDSVIERFVTQATKKPYVKGTAYYQLVKSEIIQPKKKVIIRDRVTDKVYEGQAARDLLGLPATKQRVKPTDLGNYDVFVLSTSYTRKLSAGTELLIRK